MFFDNDSVYYIVPNKGINHDSAIQAFKDVLGYLFVGAFITSSQNREECLTYKMLGEPAQVCRKIPL